MGSPDKLGLESNTQWAADLLSALKDYIDRKTIASDALGFERTPSGLLPSPARGGGGVSRMPFQMYKGTDSNNLDALFVEPGNILVSPGGSDTFVPDWIASISYNGFGMSTDPRPSIPLKHGFDYQLYFEFTNSINVVTKALEDTDSPANTSDLVILYSHPQSVNILMTKEEGEAIPADDPHSTHTAAFEKTRLKLGKFDYDAAKKTLTINEQWPGGSFAYQIPPIFVDTPYSP